MAKESKIEWTDATWNPWHGCQKVSPGCKYCYMFRDKAKYGKKGNKVKRSKTRFTDPLRWSMDMQMGMPRGNAFPGMKIFTCSWSDFFIPDADEWRAEAWHIIKKTPEFTYQILTKRPHLVADRLPKDWGDGYANVWLGISAEDKNTYITRSDAIAEIPAHVKFVSFEPLLEQIDLGPLHDLVFDWGIIGGESGNNTGKYIYRPTKSIWIENLIYEHKLMKVPVFVKQLGTHLAKVMCMKDRHGRDMDEWPLFFRLREFPTK